MKEQETRLIEADHTKIEREAMVRTVMEDPEFAQRAFEAWRVEREREIDREFTSGSFSTAWARVAWLAEGRMHRMGRELDKLQRRIGRQRKANRRLRERVRELETRSEEKSRRVEKPEVES